MTIVDVSFEIDFAIDKTSKSSKAAFWGLGKRISRLRAGSTGEEIATYFMARERLGSTAIGNGVAVPQAIFPMPQGPLLQVTRLSQPVDFEAPYGNPVDLMFAIVGDRRDQRQLRKAIHRCSELVRNPAVLKDIRTASCLEDLVRILNHADISGVPANAAWPMQALS